MSADETTPKLAEIVCFPESYGRSFQSSTQISAADLARMPKTADKVWDMVRRNRAPLDFDTIAAWHVCVITEYYDTLNRLGGDPKVANKRLECHNKLRPFIESLGRHLERLGHSRDREEVTRLLDAQSRLMEQANELADGKKTRSKKT